MQDNASQHSESNSQRSGHDLCEILQDLLQLLAKSVARELSPKDDVAQAVDGSTPSRQDSSL